MPPIIHSKLVATCGIAAAALALIAAPALAGSDDECQDAAYQAKDSDMHVRGESPQRGFAGTASDAWITTKVRARLIRRPGIPPFAINVDTNDGVVTLFGSLGADVDKLEASRQAMMVSGVTDVRNELQVVAQDAYKKVEKHDGQIRDLLAQRLDERDGLGNDDIDVEVANGVVRLTGSVDRSGDRMTALSVARTTQGVRSVVDDLRVDLEG